MLKFQFSYFHPEKKALTWNKTRCLQYNPEMIVYKYSFNYWQTIQSKNKLLKILENVLQHLETFHAFISKRTILYYFQFFTCIDINTDTPSDIIRYHQKIFSAISHISTCELTVTFQFFFSFNQESNRATIKIDHRLLEISIHLNLDITQMEFCYRIIFPNISETASHHYVTNPAIHCGQDILTY